MDELLVAFGSEIKALGGGRVGGYLVRFTDATRPDLDGDFFTAETDFDAKSGDAVTVYYNHGLDPRIKRRKLGNGTMQFDDIGVWVEAQLSMRDEYERAIYQMAEAGKLGWSSGTLPNLVEREPVGKSMHVKSWPLGKDASLTPTPAAGIVATQVQTLKTWAEATAHFQVETAQADDIANGTEAKAAKDARSASPHADAGGDSDNTTIHGGSNMSTPDVIVKQDRAPEQVFQDQLKAILSDWQVSEIKPLQENVKSVNSALEEILKRLDNEPASKTAGYVTVDGGTADKGIKSFGDFLLAIRRKDAKRLTQVYGSIKAMGEDSGVGGGYLVPEDYSNQLIQLAGMTNQITQRVTQINVSTASGTYPSLDQFAAPTAGSGNTAFAAGVTSAVTAEAGTLTSTDATFEALQWRVHKVGGYSQASMELINDSPQSLEALLRSLFLMAVAAKTERNILRGTGVGEPLGILNSTAIINVTPGTNSAFTWVDVAAMKSRFKAMNGAPVWLIHPGVWPDIYTMEIGTGGANAWVANMQAGVSNSINGYQIIESEHLPQDDNSGDVILADLSAYVLFRRSGLIIDYSEHVGFLTDQGTWRFTERVDGMPWLRYPVTLADPQGSYTVSPFVVHND